MKTFCPFCNKMYECEKEQFGQEVHCGECGRFFTARIPESMKTCPFCLEEIKAAAVKCRYCGEFQDQKPARHTEKKGDAGSESTIAECHPSWKNYYGDIILAALLCLIGVGLIILPILLISCYLVIRCYRYRVTTARIICKTGILEKKQTEIRIKDMRAAKLHQTFKQRIFGVGDVRVGTAAGADDEIRIVGIANPQELIDTINGLRSDD